MRANFHKKCIFTYIILLFIYYKSCLLQYALHKYIKGMKRRGKYFAVSNYLIKVLFVSPLYVTPFNINARNEIIATNSDGV